MKNLNLILIALALGVVLFVVLFKKKESVSHKLPYYAPLGVDSTLKDGEMHYDTVYHKVFDYKLINQYGDTITSATMKNAVYIADFFFTTCKSICPIMTSSLQKIYLQYKNNPQVKFISHTVDPEMDSVAQLKNYALLHNAEGTQWQFVTGNKKELYHLARKGYLVSVEDGDGGSEDFIHTPQLILVDKNKHIRGYYDGTDSLEVNRLLVDLKLLLAEK